MCVCMYERIVYRVLIGREGRAYLVGRLSDATVRLGFLFYGWVTVLTDYCFEWGGR